MTKYFRNITALLAQSYRSENLKKAKNLKGAKKRILKKTANAHKYVYNRQLAIYVRGFLVVFLLILSGVLLQILVFMNSRYNQVRMEQEKRAEEYKYWVNVAQQYTSVPDVLFNASLSAFKIGKKDEALKFVREAISIDPLFEKAYLLQNEISNL